MFRPCHSNPSRHCNQRYFQTTLFTTQTNPVATHHTVDSTWGHKMESIDEPRTFRVIFQNPRGLKLTTDLLGTQFCFSMGQTNGIAALCLAETNVNWSLRSTDAKLKEILCKTWKHTSTITSHMKEENLEECQPGGTLAMVCNKWTSRVIEKGVDPFGLGRWTYIILRGKTTPRYFWYQHTESANRH